MVTDVDFSSRPEHRARADQLTTAPRRVEVIVLQSTSHRAPPMGQQRRRQRLRSSDHRTIIEYEKIDFCMEATLFGKSFQRRHFLRFF